MCSRQTRACIQKFLGANMVIVSPITIGLGIANVVLTYYLNQATCGATNSCSILTNSLALTWVAVAIWAPIPIFFNGIGAIWIAGKPSANNSWLCFLSATNSFASGPVIFIVTAAEAVSKLPAGGVATLTGTALALYGIEVTIAIVGAVLWLHVLAIFYLNNCCCNFSGEEDDSDDDKNYEDNGDDNLGYANNRRPSPRRGQAQEASDDNVDRLNLWSAYRFLNNNGGYSGGNGVLNGGYYGGNGGFNGGYYGGIGGYSSRPVAPTPARSEFYANGAAPPYIAGGVYSGYAGVYPLGPRGLYVGAGPSPAIRR